MPTTMFADRRVRNEDDSWEYWLVSLEAPGKILCHRDGPAFPSDMEDLWVEQMALIEKARETGDKRVAPPTPWTEFDASQREDVVKYFAGADSSDRREAEVRQFLNRVFD